MSNNKKDFKGAMTGLFGESISNGLSSPVVEEKVTKEESKPVEPKVEVKKEVITTKKRTYNLPTDILEDIEKLVYMDRDIKDNTDLIIRALKKYISSKDNQALLSEYDSIKGGNK